MTGRIQYRGKTEVSRSRTAATAGLVTLHGASGQSAAHRLHYFVTSLGTRATTEKPRAVFFPFVRLSIAARVSSQLDSES